MVKTHKKNTRKGGSSNGPVNKGNTHVLHARHFTGTVFAASNFATVQMLVDCSSTGIASEWTTLTSLYEQYRFTKITLRWLPMVAPGVSAAGGRGYVTIDTNSEHIESYVNSFSPATTNAKLKNDAYTKDFSVWKDSFYYTVPITMRKKWFDVNSTIVYGADTIDRSVQAAIISSFDSIGASDNLGIWTVDYTLVLRGLSSIST